MSKKVKIDDLTKTINGMLSDYSDDVIEETKGVVDEVTKEARKIVRENAPVKTGKYKRSIKSKKLYESLTEKRNAIYSDGYSGLTHLLENGHAKTNGGRTRAFPHWKQGNDYIVEQLPKQLKKKIGGK